MESNFELVYDPTSVQEHDCFPPMPENLPDEVPWAEGVVVKCTQCRLYWTMVRNSAGHLYWKPQRELLEALGKL